MKNQFTREDVINIIEDILQRPDQVTDAMYNEQTSFDAESFLEMAEKSIETQHLLNLIPDGIDATGEISDEEGQ